MTAQDVARVIQLILAPVVMVSACAILVGGLLTRYGAINDRLRAMVHERLDLLRTLHAQGGSPDPFSAERITEIDRQVPDLLKRHAVLHDSVLAVYVAVLLFVTSMFVIAVQVSVASAAAWAGTVVLALFLCGTAALFIGVVLTATEVRASRRSLLFEVGRVEHLVPGGTPTGGDNRAAERTS